MISSSACRIAPRWLRTSQAALSCRQYHTTQQALKWWNPFSRGSARVTSAKTTGTDAEDPRRIQERKDTTLAMLAMEFRRLGLVNPNLEREKVVDMAFDALGEQQLDSKTLMQLRHALQESLQDQVVELFQHFANVDKSFPDPDSDEDEAGSITYDPVLAMELELAIDQLANPTPLKAAKGADPKLFFTLKRGAVETLLERRNAYHQSVTATPIISTEGGNEESTKNFAILEADEFGYHETIDDEQNQQIRHYQTVNLSRAAKLRNECGYSVIALQSSIPGAGRGVYVDGYAKAGSILAFQPGEVWSKEHLVSLPVEEERKLEKNDNYQMSLRPDDFMIDSRKSPYTVLTNNNSNPMAVGHIINHPTPSNPPSCRSVMMNFTQTMNLGPLKRYIPNTYARPRNLTLTGSLWEKDVVDMHGICLIATRDICNEEIFYDYRLLTSQRPSWYHLVQDTAYKSEEDEEATDDEESKKA